MRIICIAALAAIAVSAAADLTPERTKLNVDSFEYAWKTIRDKMWEPMPVDWQKVHDELLPKVKAAKTMPEARAVMNDMISRLKMTHFGIVPGDVYEGVASGATGDGRPGFDIRVLEGDAIVTRVEEGSPAERAGVKTGWKIVSAGGKELAPMLAKISETFKSATTRELILSRAATAAISGAIGQRVQVKFMDSPTPIELELVAPRGAEAKFGFLPPQHVWYESRKIGNTGYIGFNMFMDPARIAGQFADSVQSCMTCNGIIIDLRGNPGGIGAMSMGMAGLFIGKANQRLGVMKLKDSELKFIVNPRSQTFAGPLVILTDGLTGSTSEIFAGGMKDLGRAHITGTRSAGAALPSMFEKLPNGDGFQYAVANYISEGGRPLEGVGVIPDEEVKLTREALLAGRDPVLERALAWIGKQKESTK